MAVVQMSHGRKHLKIHDLDLFSGYKAKLKEKIRITLHMYSTLTARIEEPKPKLRNYLETLTLVFFRF